jgi:hypothetical protein
MNLNDTISIDMMSNRMVDWSDCSRSWSEGEHGINIA